MMRYFAQFVAPQVLARTRRSSLVLALLLTLVMAATGSLPSFAADPGLVTGRPDMQTPAPSGRLVVKFAAGSGLTMVDGQMAADPARPGSEAARDRLEALASQLVPAAKLAPRFPSIRPDRDKQATAAFAAVLTRYAHLDAGTADRTFLLRMIGALNADPAVEMAFLEPVAVPAALGFDAFDGGSYTPPPPPAGTVSLPPLTPPATPDFEYLQDYLEAAPLGVGAIPMRAQAGALGTDISIIDVEGAWLWAHEDLPTPFADLGTHIDDISWRNHGTAVMGEMRGVDNGLGVTGIAPSATVGCSSVGATSVADAILTAAANLEAGDVILIELHAPGPNADGNGQFGYVPMEYWQDNFDAIRYVTTQGIIICEAAGNGYQNLDDAVYENLFDRTVRDSGAIMCGATEGSTLYSAAFSNNGTRVDLNGYGWSVVTCAYGDLQTGDETEWYTAQFSGTSSASPIVTGSVASLQGMVRQRHGFALDARLARDILRETGTPMSGGNLIGNRPDLVAAFAHADTAIGELVGTVTDLDTGLPVAGVEVQVLGEGSFTVTAADGTWRLPLVSGLVFLEFTSYLYETLATNAMVAPVSMTTKDVSLVPRARIDITGRVYGSGGPLADALIDPVDQPFAATTSGLDGRYTLASVPVGYIYTLRCDGVPGFGARVRAIDTAGATSDLAVDIGLPPIQTDFEGTDDGFVSSNGLWTRGLPPADVTGGAFSGSECWGIGMTASYLDSQSDTLRSPVYDLSGIAETPYYLSFHFNSATEGGFDGVTLEAYTDPTAAVMIPECGYTDTGLSGLGGSPGWSGYTGRWQGAVFDVSDFVGGDFQFQLRFGSDEYVTDRGFYVDGFVFSGVVDPSAVPDGEVLTGQIARLQAWPNPFNPAVNIRYQAVRKGTLQIRVFDLRGRLVRTLLNAPVARGEGIVTWNGRTDRGRSAASGVYLVRMTDETGFIASQRVLLAK